MSSPLDTVGNTPELAWGGRRFWTGVWRVVDPKITLASVASLFLGTAAAARDGDLHVRWLAVTVFGIFLLEAAKNMSGELFDWDSGTDARVTQEDRSPFSGGKRVLVDGLMTRKQTAVVAFVLYALTALVGILVVIHEPRVALLGLSGAAIAYFYHAPPLKLAYRGFGELAVMLTYGPMILCGAYLVQRGALPSWLLHLGVTLGIAISAFLFVNELPDARADAESGKRTLVVLLGKQQASRAFALFPVVTYGYLLALPALTPVGPGVWLGFIGLPFAVAAARRVWTRHERTVDIIPAQGWTLLSFLLLALGSGVGLLLWR